MKNLMALNSQAASCDVRHSASLRPCEQKRRSRPHTLQRQPTLRQQLQSLVHALRLHAGYMKSRPRKYQHAIEHNVGHLQRLSRLLEILVLLQPSRCRWGASQEKHASKFGQSDPAELPWQIRLDVHLLALQLQGLPDQWDVLGLQLRDVLRDPMTWQFSGAGEQDVPWSLVAFIDHVNEVKLGGKALQITFHPVLDWHRIPGGAVLYRRWTHLCIYLYRNTICATQQPAWLSADPVNV